MIICRGHVAVKSRAHLRLSDMRLGPKTCSWVCQRDVMLSSHVGKWKNRPYRNRWYNTAEMKFAFAHLWQYRALRQA